MVEIQTDSIGLFLPSKARAHGAKKEATKEDLARVEIKVDFT